ncbi:MAG: DUF1223 domain-containing protein [Paracoccaceae bacterium]|jgi:hypothetical protein
MTNFLTYLRILAVSGFGVFVTWGAQAQSLVVLELFTSQGCPSCPPADSLMKDWVKRDDVLPLALHVDYWDYIGWKDKFGQSKFSDRQKSYAVFHKEKSVYTPQVVINGAAQTQGSKVALIGKLIVDAQVRQDNYGLQLTKMGQNLMIKARSPKSFELPMIVQLVRYRLKEEVQIKNGENANKTITYLNIVTSWETVGQWSGEAPLSIVTRHDGNDQTAVILQEQGPSQILAAARLP